MIVPTRVDRRFVLIGLAGAVPALAPLVASAVAIKSPLCAACNGHGNCESDACIDGFCAPNRDVCPDASKRNLYRCKGKQHDQPRCCKPSGRKCRNI